MALPVVIAKNQTGGGIFLPRLGLTVPALGQTTLTDYCSFYEISWEDALQTPIGDGDIVINDGVRDLSADEALGYLDATGNLNGPVTGATEGMLVRLTDSSGRYTEVANIKLYDPAGVDPVAPAPGNGDLYYNTVAKKWKTFDSGTGTWVFVSTGDVSGPAVSEKYGIARYADTTGKVIEDTQVRMYPEAAIDPVPGGGVPAPTAGDMYFNTAIKHWMYYDATRTKWLSIDSNAFQVGSQGNVPVGSYFRGIAGNILSATAGYTAQYNGTVVGLSWSRGDNDATNLQVMASGVQIASVASASVSGYDNALNGDFGQGTVLALRNDAAGNAVSDPQIWIWVKWRST